MFYDLCAVGNALVDIIVSTDDAFLEANQVTKGGMALVDDKISKTLFARARATAEMSSGGSAANTVAGFASFGGKAAFIGKIGKDQFGEVFAHDLQAQNVHFDATPSPTLPTGHCLIFVTPDAQRSMCACLGAANEFDFGDVDETLIQNAAVTYLEGYLFDKPSAQQAFHKIAKTSHDASRKIALTLSDTFCVARHRAAFLDLVKSDVDILFANENEIMALYETQDLDAAIAAARAHVSIAVITRGAQPACVAIDERVYRIPVEPVASVLDTTGAGDLYAAGFLFGMTQGRTLPEAAHFGAKAAAEVISHYGPRPQKKLSSII